MSCWSDLCKRGEVVNDTHSTEEPPITEGTLSFVKGFSLLRGYPEKY